MNRPLDSSDRMMLETASSPGLPVAIIGAGPVGLAAAVHLLGHGLEPVILEAGAQVGTAVRDWGHVPMFSPWGYSTDRTAVALLQRQGWTHPDEAGYPTGLDLAERYLDPLAATPEIVGRLRLETRVTGITRAGHGKIRTAGRGDRPFEVRYVDGSGQEGRIFARAVIDASGTWSSPNPAGAGGLPAIGERAAATRIRYGMPDVLGRERDRYAGRRVLVLGSGHSATGTLLDLADLTRQVPGTSIVWAFRNTDRAKLFGGGEADQLPRRGALGLRLRALAETGAYEIVAPFAVDAIETTPDGGLRVLGDRDGAVHAIAADEMVVATGLRPDLSILGELRVDLDPALDCPRALAPLIDPNEHSCGTVRPHGAAELAQPEPGLFIIGMKAYGRAPTFLLATGYEQARSVAAHLAGDHEAARRVELVLPETGVCNGPGRRQAEAATCCGPAAQAAPATASACC
ncbi:NAD(P)-binding domain-containing protein [Inquilinus sp. NPDC058860]|uniref:NAD(P)-binding domain-containing protein n=1 Tax=Inquilinus sp. NPDC058860 TaxID=3346652 RepID=UPI00367BA6AC